VLVFEVKPALVADDNVVKMGSLHILHRVKKLTAFCGPHLPKVVCQLVWDPAEVKIFIPSHFCKRLKTVAGDTPRASASEYAKENGSLYKHAIILAWRRSLGGLPDLGSSCKFWRPQLKS
jgi:hypothetical protein